jgi:hypothetical protein
VLSDTTALFDNGPDWFFTWDGKKLQNITTLQTDMYQWRGKEVPNSNMYSASAVDIDHRGPMQIVGNNGDYDKFPPDDGISSSGTLTLFRYNGSSYAAAKTLLFLAKFEPQPPNWSESMNGSWTYANIHDIDMHQTPAPSYQLKIVNGDRDGSNRVTSAKVEINGVTIVLPTEVNQGVETLTRTIQLQQEDEIKVTVDGPEKSHIYVTVE